MALSIMILSGGTGHTARTVLRAALAQFGSIQVDLIVKARIRRVSTALAAVREAARRQAIVFHSLVEPKVRAAVLEELERYAVPTVDVLGPAIRVLGDHLGQEPKGKPGLAYELNKEQFDRIDAVDFTLTHDDGQNLRDLHQADVVLVGVSRVAKSVTCFYLASRGIRAANVPLIPELPVPEELTSLPSQKVIGLTMNVGRLVAIRRVRKGIQADAISPGYCDPRAVEGELRWARRLMTGHGWRSIDVSYMAVEEIALEVRRLIGQ